MSRRPCPALLCPPHDAGRLSAPGERSSPHPRGHAPSNRRKKRDLSKVLLRRAKQPTQDYPVRYGSPCVLTQQAGTPPWSNGRAKLAIVPIQSLSGT